MERPPKKYVCEKCGYLGDTSEHEGCDYLAWTTGEQLYIDQLEAEIAKLRASPASAPEGWKHSCNALCLDDVELWIPQCPHCGKPAPTPPVSEDRKDAERWRWITREGRARELRIPAQENKTSIDAAIDGAIKKAMQEDKS